MKRLTTCLACAHCDAYERFVDGNAIGKHVCPKCNSASGFTTRYVEDQATDGPAADSPQAETTMAVDKNKAKRGTSGESRRPAGPREFKFDAQFGQFSSSGAGGTCAVGCEIGTQDDYDAQDIHDLLVGAQVDVTIRRAVRGDHADAPGQERMTFADDEFTGIANIASVSMKGTGYGFRLSFNANDCDATRLMACAKASGQLKVKRVGDAKKGDADESEAA